MTRRNRRSKLLPASVRLEITARAGRRYVQFLRRGLTGAIAILRPSLTDISIALVGDTTMSRLHEQFMGISGPTDVLTFPLDCDSRGRVSSGEIIICVPHAIRQARSRSIEIRRELLLYALHGTLHLVGFDDKTESGFRQMHRKEDEILTKMGFGPVFIPSATAHPPRTRSFDRAQDRPRLRGAS